MENWKQKIFDLCEAHLEKWNKAVKTGVTVAEYGNILFAIERDIADAKEFDSYWVTQYARYCEQISQLEKRVCESLGLYLNNGIFSDFVDSLSDIIIDTIGITDNKDIDIFCEAFFTPEPSQQKIERIMSKYGC